MRSRRVVPVALALALGLSVWEVVSVASARWLPGIVEVAAAAVGLLDSDTLMADFGATIRRVLTVWLATVVVGVAIGVAAGFWWWLRALLRPLLAVALAIPDLVYIIMVVLILGTSESSGLISLVLAIAPLVINVSMNAVLERDTRLDEMSRTYRLNRFDYARSVLWWQIRPALHAATVTAFAFSWKLMVLLEAVTTSTGVGARIMEEFRYLRPAEMIAYALVFTVLMKLAEVAVVDRLFSDRLPGSTAQPRRLQNA